MKYSSQAALILAVAHESQEAAIENYVQGALDVQYLDEANLSVALSNLEHLEAIYSICACLHDKLEDMELPSLYPHYIKANEDGSYSYTV